MCQAVFRLDDFAAEILNARNSGIERKQTDGRQTTNRSRPGLSAWRYWPVLKGSPQIFTKHWF